MSSDVNVECLWAYAANGARNQDQYREAEAAYKQLRQKIEQLTGAIEDAVSVLDMEGCPSTLEPRASLEAALSKS